MLRYATTGWFISLFWHVVVLCQRAGDAQETSEAFAGVLGTFERPVLVLYWCSTCVVLMLYLSCSALAVAWMKVLLYGPIVFPHNGRLLRNNLLPPSVAEEAECAVYRQLTGRMDTVPRHLTTRG